MLHHRSMMSLSPSFWNMESESITTIDDIARVKLNLMSHDPASQIIAVSWITEKLKVMSEDDRGRFIEVLITTDVATYLCEKIRSSHGHLFLSILSIVEKLGQNDIFYQKNLARPAIDSIICVAFVIAKKRETHEETLATIAYTIFVIINGSTHAKVPLKEVCDVDQMILLMKNLNLTRSNDCILRVSVVKILRTIMENINPESEETISLLFQPFENSLRSIRSIVVRSEDATHLELAEHSMVVMLSICTVASRFFNTLRGPDFAEKITRVTIDNIIPRFKGILTKVQHLEERVKNFVECLNQLFQSSNRTKELANVVAENGYLKHLLLIQFPSLRESIALLMSRIIVELSEDDFSQDVRAQSSEFFREFINDGIMGLPPMTNGFGDASLILETEGGASDAFIVLSYHHAVKTSEYNFVPLSSIILKIVTLSDVTPIPILKAVWFLFAVSSLKRSASDFVCYYRVAVEHLANLLQRRDIGNCYTHSPAIFEHSLSSTIFPIEFRHEIVRLWLEFDGDIESVVALKNVEFTDNCLLHIVEFCEEKIVNRAVDAIARLKSDETRWAEMLENIWKKLPKHVGSIIAETAANVKALLNLARDTTPPEEHRLETHKASISASAKILTSGYFDDELKIAFLRYIHYLLKLSRVRNSQAVVEFCVKDSQLVGQLCEEGLARKNFELSSFCIELLVYIVEYQKKFRIQCDENRVKRIEPLKMLVLISRSNYKLFLASVRLLANLLNHRTDVILSVTLCDFEDRQAAEKAIFAWFRQLQQILPKTKLADWKWIYRCLIAVLKFCEKESVDTVRKLCEYAGTYEIFKWTIRHRYTDLIFPEFVKFWLHCSAKYGSASMAQAIYARCTQARSISDNEFEQIIQALTEYKNRLANCRANV